MIPHDTYTVARSGQPLSAISPLIRVTDVTETAEETVRTSPRAAGDGAFLTRASRTSLEVRIQFAVLEADAALRTAILTRIARWARSGDRLTLADRPGLYLPCICTALPAVQSKRKWSGLAEMTFTAYDRPFWQEEEPVCYPLSGGRTVISVPGSAPTVIGCALVNATGEMLTDASLTCCGHEMTFSGLAWQPGETLLLSHEGLQAITLNGASILHLRQGADELRVTGGDIVTLTVCPDGLTGHAIVRGCCD